MNGNEGATLVMGADSDIGAEIVRSLSGCVVAHYFSAQSKLDGLETSDRSIIPIWGDLSTREGIEGFIGLVRDLKLPISRIVYLPCAPASPTRFRKLETEALERDMNIVYLAAALVCRELVPEMAKARFGRVVFMLTSYCVGVPPKFLASYVASKYALMGLMKALAAEFADKGVTVNGIAPSMVETKFVAELSGLTVEKSAQENPTGRNARPADIVPLVSLLLSNGNEYTTGAVIPVTGGSGF